MSSHKKDDYKVGYKNPPRETQWKKGESGNRKGRPPRPKNIAAALQRILDEPVPTKNGDPAQQPSAQEALLRRQIIRAIEGDQRAFDFVMKQAQRCGLIARPAQQKKPKGILLVPDPRPEEDMEAALEKLRERQANLPPWDEFNKGR